MSLYPPREDASPRKAIFTRGARGDPRPRRRKSLLAHAFSDSHQRMAKRRRRAHRRARLSSVPLRRHPLASCPQQCLGPRIVASFGRRLRALAGTRHCRARASVSCWGGPLGREACRATRRAHGAGGGRSAPRGSAQPRRRRRSRSARGDCRRRRGESGMADRHTARPCASDQRSAASRSSPSIR
jgi:hypothetical protein